MSVSIGIICDHRRNLANPDFGIANFDNSIKIKSTKVIQIKLSQKWLDQSSVHHSQSGGKDYKSRNAKQFDIDELRLMAEAKPLSVLVFQCLTFVQDLECVKNNIVIK